MKKSNDKLGNQIKYVIALITVVISLSSCEKDETLEQLESTNKEQKTSFNFNQFGKTHNEYLAYVWNIKDQNNPEARFNHGLTFTDPTFGSFNKGQKFSDIDIEFHKKRVSEILEGTYNAKNEKLSKPMTIFLQKLASTSKKAVDNQLTIKEFTQLIEQIEENIYANEKIQIDLRKGISNDGASMLAIASILKYSTLYWATFKNTTNSDDIENTPLAKGKLWRALADAWGYVSAWTNNGDGSYSWDHQSALVNADCVSDKVREN